MPDKFYNEAMNAINRVFSDLSVPHDVAIQRLQGLRDEIDVMIDAAKTAIRIQEREEK